ncbi:MAG: 8-amino-7-oxononanoate synthase [Ignavibacteria bacterium]|jgi:8-amino-7-oxononanoate synthase|nr:8-amino-7-oxononanoate synthase [Ignavibacteria bacterium]
MRLSYLEKQLDILKKESNFRTLPNAKSAGKYVEINGNRMLNLSYNDYLGLASNKKLRAKFLENIDIEKFIPSSSSSRLLGGSFDEYIELETMLAELFHKESSLVFNSGYHLNIGILPAIANTRTLILADKLIHASIIDGIILSRANFLRYKHNDYEHLEKLIKANHSNYTQIIIVTESVFSMDGDRSDLQKLVEIKQKYDNILLYVDEAHAVGVFGKNGLGIAEEENCINEIDFLVGTFGKALASVGGYIVCDKIIRDFLINKMRSFIFSTALPPINISWTKFILENLPYFNNKRNHLQNITNKFISSLQKRNYTTPSKSHIVPLIIGDNELSINKSNYLQENGFYTLAVRPPAVPVGQSRIRISLNADLEEQDIDNLIALL